MILHITNDYSGSTVYMNLVRELDNEGIEQIIYNPIRDANRIGKNYIPLKCSNSEIIYRKILSKYSDRIFYKRKINKIVNDIESNIDLSKITYIHAHTWYSDGGVAYELSVKYNIPYMIAVRNTDLNLFLKYYLPARKYGKQILLKAQNIVTISVCYHKRILKESSLNDILPLIKSKIIVVPNGVDSFWLENKVTSRKLVIDSKEFNLLYIGKFDKGKNVLNLIKATQLINHENHYKVHLNLVGGGGKDEQSILKLIEKDSNIKYLGKIYDKVKLLEVYQQNDYFVMPSKAETFGLVYIEALLQGLPILYTKNEGIDGYYDDSIGEKVINTSIIEIKNSILKLIEGKHEFKTHILSINHNWNSIAKKYIKLYK